MTTTSEPNSEPVNPGFAVLIADSLYKNATGFIELMKYGGGIESGSFQSHQDQESEIPIGDFASAAINISLATELVFKAIHLSLSRACPKTHKLVELFSTIPESDIRWEIEREYNGRLDPRMRRIEFAFSPRPDETQEDLDRSGTEDLGQDHSITRTLELCDNSFVTFRYLHERISKEKIETVSFDFGRMSIIFLTAREIAARETYRLAD